MLQIAERNNTRGRSFGNIGRFGIARKEFIYSGEIVVILFLDRSVSFHFARKDELYIFASLMEVVAQLVRAPDCGSGGRGFEPLLSPLSLLI